MNESTRQSKTAFSKTFLLSPRPSLEVDDRHWRQSVDGALSKTGPNPGDQVRNRDAKIEELSSPQHSVGQLSIRYSKIQARKSRQSSSSGIRTPLSTSSRGVPANIVCSIADGDAGRRNTVVNDVSRPRCAVLSSSEVACLNVLRQAELQPEGRRVKDDSP